MAANMKVIGRMIKPMATEDLYIPMVIAILEIGLMTKLMEEVLINIWMVQHITAIGKRISNTDMELRLGLMRQSTKETMNMERSMVSGHLNGLTDLHI